MRSFVGRFSKKDSRRFDDIFYRLEKFTCLDHSNRNCHGESTVLEPVWGDTAWLASKGIRIPTQPDERNWNVAGTWTTWQPRSGKTPNGWNIDTSATDCTYIYLLRYTAFFTTSPKLEFFMRQLFTYPGPPVGTTFDWQHITCRKHRSNHPLANVLYVPWVDVAISLRLLWSLIAALKDILQGE